MNKRQQYPSETEKLLHVSGHKKFNCMYESCCKFKPDQILSCTGEVDKMAYS